MCHYRKMNGLQMRNKNEQQQQLQCRNESSFVQMTLFIDGME